MKDEIKEILDKLKDSATNPIVDVPVMGGVSEPIDNSQCLEPNECKTLLDYITNLQEENERLKDIVVEKDCQLKDMMLQKTDYTAVNILEMKLEYYKSRNEKAIEYIKNNIDNTGWLEIGSNNVKELLEILGDKE